MYLILGCGDVGTTLASELRKRGAETTLVDVDSKKVKWLENSGYKAFVGDFGLPHVLRNAGIERAEVVLLMTPNFQAMEQALGAINRLKTQLKIDPTVIVRVHDEKEVDDAKRLGANDALPSSQILASSTLDRFQQLKGVAKEKQLRALLRELRGRKMAIVLQTNPDPDGIASGVALKRYAKAFGVDADIIYDGRLGHPQNRAIVNLLELDLLGPNVKFSTYTAFALVDVATHANCSLPKNILPTIVIDHHSVPSSEVRARFCDIRPVGAASTLLTDYLRHGAVEIDGATAAALMVGILTDTMYFARGTTPQDFEAFRYLRGLADLDLLRRLQSPPMSQEALDLLARAIKSSKLKGGYLITNVGEAKNRDLIAQTADFLLKREGVMTVLAYGICDSAVYASARTNDVALHLGQTLNEAFSSIGSAGGHARMAGATIPLKVFGRGSKRSVQTEINRKVGRRFLEVVGAVKPKTKRKHSKR